MPAGIYTCILPHTCWKSPEMACSHDFSPILIHSNYIVKDLRMTKRLLRLVFWHVYSSVDNILMQAICNYECFKFLFNFDQFFHVMEKLKWATNYQWNILWWCIVCRSISKKYFALGVSKHFSTFLCDQIWLTIYIVKTKQCLI